MRGGFISKKAEAEFEKQRLELTVALATSQLEQARLNNEGNNSEIVSLRQEMRDNAPHAASGSLWSSDGFESMVALNQYVSSIMNKVAEYDATENRIALLRRLIDSPYFARVDFKFSGGDALEKIYIGRSSLKDDATNSMCVYDWRSPIAGLFYRFSGGPAFYEAPAGRITGELGLKRQYEISGGLLEYFFDADVQIIDEFLRKLLAQNASVKMKTIVETIQKEQDIVIRDMENDLMMVQGVAGSGKTSIALHRAAYLMYQGLSAKLAANDIVIVSPNALFARYISQVLPELGEDNVVSLVFEDLLATILPNKRIQSRNRFLETLLTGPRYNNIMKASLEFKTSQQFIEILNRFIDDLPSRWIEFGDVYYGSRLIAGKEGLKNKILGGRKDIPLGLRLKLLADSVLEDVRDVHKVQGNKQEYARVKKEVKEFAELDVEYLYRKLLEDEEYFYSLAGGLDLPERVEDILIFARKNLSCKALCYDDAAVLAFLRLKLNRYDEYKNIRQVVIDEAQDYYPLHYEICKLLFAGAKYTILGDIDQTLEKREDISLYERIGDILNKKKSALVIMDKSFRCTNEILAFASKFISQNVEIRSFNRQGSEPKIHVAVDRQTFCEMIISETKACLTAGYQSVGLICRSEKNALSLYECLKNSIGIHLVGTESAGDLQGVFVIPVYMSKGLEFDAVLLCDADSENYRSEDDKKLLYISCTRALHRLNLFCQGEASPLL